MSDVVGRYLTKHHHFLLVADHHVHHRFEEFESKMRFDIYLLIMCFSKWDVLTTLAQSDALLEIISSDINLYTGKLSRYWMSRHGIL